MIFFVHYFSHLCINKTTPSFIQGKGVDAHLHVYPVIQSNIQLEANSFAFLRLKIFKYENVVQYYWFLDILRTIKPYKWVYRNDIYFSCFIYHFQFTSEPPIGPITCVVFLINLFNKKRQLINLNFENVVVFSSLIRRTCFEHMLL